MLYILSHFSVDQKCGTPKMALSLENMIHHWKFRVHTPLNVETCWNLSHLSSEFTCFGHPWNHFSSVQNPCWLMIIEAIGGLYSQCVGDCHQICRWISHRSPWYRPQKRMYPPVIKRRLLENPPFTDDFPSYQPRHIIPGDKPPHPARLQLLPHCRSCPPPPQCYLHPRRHRHRQPRPRRPRCQCRHLRLCGLGWFGGWVWDGCHGDENSIIRLQSTV